MHSVSVLFFACQFAGLAPSMIPTSTLHDSAASTRWRIRYVFRSSVRPLSVINTCFAWRDISVFTEWIKRIFATMWVRALLKKFCKIRDQTSRIQGDQLHFPAVAYMYSVSQKKVAPLKLFAIFLLRLSIFPWNFANLLWVYIHTCIPILVDFS